MEQFHGHICLCPLHLNELESHSPPPHSGNRSWLQDANFHFVYAGLQNFKLIQSSQHYKMDTPLIAHSSTNPTGYRECFLSIKSLLSLNKCSFPKLVLHLFLPSIHRKHTDMLHFVIWIIPISVVASSFS